VAGEHQEPIEEYARRGVNPDRMAAIGRHAIGSVLDVGCGSGAYVLELSARGRPALGLDRHRFDSWRVARGRFAQGDSTHLPVADNAVDTVVSFETLEHVADPALALAEYKRVSRSRLILSVPNCELTPGLKHSNLVYHHWTDPTHVNFWTLDSLVNWVERNGLVVRERELINRIDIAPFFAEALALPPAAARVLSRLARSRIDRYRMTCLVVADIV
jgi:SAM-dependent methyltransferase